MPKYMKHLIGLVGLIIIGSFLAFIFNSVTVLADLAGRLNPALVPWVTWGLFLAVAVPIGWTAATVLLRPKAMMVYADPSEEDMAAFRQELLSRLKKNKLLKDAEVVINEEADMEAGLAYLKEKADEEIRATAKKVFIGTALAQNGRLDSLVVLFLISRLTWRIATIYSQRPRHKELINLYANIAATSFLAGSIEEFGVEEYVTELMTPLVGGSALGAVPGAQAVAGAITSSVLSGSTNCLLALRCGIVARDYVSLNLDAKGAMRKSATVEATRIFVSMSTETVTYVTRALVKGTVGAVKSGTSKATRGVTQTVSATADAVGSGAQRVGSGVKNTAGTATEKVKRTGRKVKSAAMSVGDGAKDAARAAKDKAGKVAHGTARTAEAARRRASTIKEGVLNARRAARAKAAAAANKADRIKETGKGKIRSTFERLKRLRKQD